MKTRKMERGGRAAEVPSANKTAGVIVDNSLNVLEFLGDTSDYLQLPSGRACFNLRLMLRAGLQHAIISAIREAHKALRPVRKERVIYKIRDKTKRISIEVNRIENHPLDKPVFRVVFQDVAPAREKPAVEAGGGTESAATVEEPTTERRIAELQRQLLDTKHNLRAIIQDHDVTLRKLLRTNDELETTSAELEAANAELEAYNDELETANSDLNAALAQRDEAEKEREKLEQQVLHAEKLKSLGLMAGGIAHDFNNVLAAILGFADLALEDLPPESPARPSIEEVVAGAERAAELTRQMLAYSGRGKFKVEAVDLSEAVRDSANLLRTSVTKKAALTFDLAEDLPSVEADTSQLQQVAMNLVTNASEAIGKAGGVIRVTTGVMAADRDYLSQTYVDDELPEGDYVYLEVSDTGCGLDSETLGRIFEPFFTTKFTGRGLGLAGVLGIVRGHGGAIKVTSRPGSGTTFRVLFPSSERPVKDSEGTSAALANWRGQGTILVVDDEEDLRTMASRTLEKHGFSVVTAEDGRDALEVFRTCADMIDAVLLDLTMPGMGGKETLLALRRIRPGVRTILSSGYDEQDASRQFADQAPAGFIQKPYRSKRLVEMVSEVLEGKPKGQKAG